MTQEEKKDDTSVWQGMFWAMLFLCFLIIVFYNPVDHPKPTVTPAAAPTEYRPWRPLLELEEYHQEHPHTICWEVLDYYGNASSLCVYQLYNMDCYVQGDAIWCIDSDRQINH